MAEKLLLMEDVQILETLRERRAWENETGGLLTAVVPQEVDGAWQFIPSQYCGMAAEFYITSNLLEPFYNTRLKETYRKHIATIEKRRKYHELVGDYNSDKAEMAKQRREQNMANFAARYETLLARRIADKLYYRQLVG